MAPFGICREKISEGGTWLPGRTGNQFRPWTSAEQIPLGGQRNLAQNSLGPQVPLGRAI